MTNIETEITKLELALIPERDPRLKEPCTPWDFTKDGDPTELVAAMAKIMLNPATQGLDRKTRTSTRGMRGRT